MSAQIVDLAKWREEHPPLVRLMNINAHCWAASWRLWGAWMGVLWRR